MSILLVQRDRESDRKIAETIISQFGHQFRRMTGVRAMMVISSGVEFKLPGSGGFAKNSINFVRVTLNGLDLYDLEFGRIRANKYTVVSRAEDVDCQAIASVFTEHTGLRTSL